MTSAKQQSGTRTRPRRSHADSRCASISRQEAREETCKDVEIKDKPNLGSYRLGLGILHATLLPEVSWPGPLCRCPCPCEQKRSCGLSGVAGPYALPNGAWQEEGCTKESRTAILRAKFGDFLTNLYKETLDTMKRLNDGADGPHFNAGALSLMSSAPCHVHLNLFRVGLIRL